MPHVALSASDAMGRGPGTSVAPATPEIRVDCADEEKFGVVERAAAHFAARYTVNRIDGARIAFPDGWGLLRASNTQPVLVLRFEATSPEALERYRAEVTGWLAAQGVRV